jgi:hypothetical protein
MLSRQLETFSKEHPELATVIRSLEDYLRWQAERGVNEIVPRVAAAKLRLSEADLLGLFTVFEDAGLVRHRYDVICTRSDGSVAPFYSLQEIPDDLFCRYCGEEHGCDDLRIELVFEIIKERISDAAA